MIVSRNIDQRLKRARKTGALVLAGMGLESVPEAACIVGEHKVRVAAPFSAPPPR